jgi:hypothetical protein
MFVISCNTLKYWVFLKSKCYLTNAAAYAAERLVLQETFLKLKIPGLTSVS